MGHDYLNINSCTSAKKWASTGMPVLCHNEPTPGQYLYPQHHLPALPHIQAVRMTHSESDNRTRGCETHSRTSRISSGKIVYDPATEPDGAHRRWLREAPDHRHVPILGLLWHHYFCRCRAPMILYRTNSFMPVLGHDEPTPGHYWSPLARICQYWAYCGTITFVAIMP